MMRMMSRGLVRLWTGDTHLLYAYYTMRNAHVVDVSYVWDMIARTVMSTSLRDHHLLT